MRALLCLPLLLTAISSLGCNGEDPPPGPEPLFPEGFETTYREVRGCRFSNEHDGVNIIVHANPEAADAYLEGRYPLPTGTILVKTEHRTSTCGDITGYTAMKKTGTGSAATDWQWQRLKADRAVDTEASAGRCVSCHVQCTDERDLTCTDP